MSHQPIQFSSDADENWHNDPLQFARLIAEIESAGGFTTALIADLSASMDLEEAKVCELIDRAQAAWDDVVARSSVSGSAPHAG
jgi:hypothetical protein